MNMNNSDLIKKAKELVNPKKLSGATVSGEVGSALISAGGNVYTGVSIHASCGIGFCAEYTAIGNMLTNSETSIKTIVAVGASGVLSPCGRCRELMYQVDLTNSNTDVILGEDKILKLKELLPEY